MKSSVVHLPFILLATQSACKSSGTTSSPGSSETVRAVSGDSQTVAITTAAPIPLVVEVLDQSGLPVSNALVSFGSTITASLSVPPNTDSAGKTKTTFTAGTAAGADTIT